MLLLNIKIKSKAQSIFGEIIVSLPLFSTLLLPSLLEEFFFSTFVVPLHRLLI